MLDKTSNIPLYLQIANIIKENILSKKYFYGQKLPSLRYLCKEFGVNISTVTNALKLLQDQGFVKAVRNVGYFISYSEKDDISSFEDFISQNIPKNAIDFASGNLPYSLYPIDEFKHSLDIVINKFGASAFDYIENKNSPLIEYLLENYLKSQNIYCKLENIIIVSGAQQGIEIVSKSFLKPGDKILIENPTYFGAYSTFRSMHLDIDDFPTGNIEFLEYKMKRFKPKALYIIPFSQNPTGFTYSIDELKWIYDLSYKNNVFIIEDDFFSDVNIFDDVNFMPIKSIDYKEIVFYVKSFSRLLMPALRLGFVISPSNLSEDVAFLKWTTDISTSLFIQLSFTEFLNRYYAIHLNRIKEYIKPKYNLFLNTILKNSYYIPQKPTGIFSVVSTKNLNAISLYNTLKQYNIYVSPYNLFYHNINNSNFIRLSFMNTEIKDIVNGLHTIFEIIKNFQ